MSENDVMGEAIEIAIRMVPIQRLPYNLCIGTIGQRTTLYIMYKPDRVSSIFKLISCLSGYKVEVLSINLLLRNEQYMQNLIPCSLAREICQ